MKIKKRICSLVVVGTLFLSGCSLEESKKAVDVEMVNDTTYRIIYEDGTSNQVECANELEASEEYSDVWYDIHGEQ